MRKDIDKTCLGAIFKMNEKGMKNQCRFKIQDVTERAYKIKQDTWLVTSPYTYTANVHCGVIHQTIPIYPMSTITLNKGCTMELVDIIIRNDQEELLEDNSLMHLRWKLNLTNLFHGIQPSEFGEALNKLKENSEYIVSPKDFESLRNEEGIVPVNTYGGWIVIGTLLVIMVGAFILYEYFRRKHLHPIARDPVINPGPILRLRASNNSEPSPETNIPLEQMNHSMTTMSTI